MSPCTILSVLVVGASVLGSVLYTKHELRKVGEVPEVSVETGNYISALETQLGELEKENQVLRDLASSGGSMVLPGELVEFVEKDLGLSFKTPPLVRKVSEDMIAEAAGQRYLAVFSESGMQMRSYAFERLGIVPPSQNFIGQLIAAETNGSRGYYDLTASEILLAADFDDENVHHLASAARLLAIALLDQYSPMPMVMTDDGFHAREAVHRGRAAMVQARFYTINARKLGFVAEKGNVEAVEVFRALASYVQDVTTFPNIFGKTYVERLYQGDKDVAMKAMMGPPKSTREVLDGVLPKDYGVVNPVAETEETQLATRMGAITVRSYLRQVLDGEAAEDLLGEFVEDELTLTTSGKKEVNAEVVWVTTWGSEAAAGEFKTAANHVAASLEMPPVIVQDGVVVRVSYLEKDVAGE